MTLVAELLAVVLVVFLVSKATGSDSPAPAVLPTPVPGKFASDFQKAASDAGGLQHLPYNAVFAQAHLETGGGTSPAYLKANNAFGFHAEGAGNAYWDGKTTYKTSNGEVLRVYRSLADSIKDYVRLIQARYPQAVQAAEVGSITGYFAGLVTGGYAGTPKTDFYNANYYQDLVARYRSIYGKEP